MESIKQSWGCGFGMLVSLDLGAGQKQEQPLRGWVGATGEKKRIQVWVGICLGGQGPESLTDTDWRRSQGMWNTFLKPLRDLITVPSTHSTACHCSQLETGAGVTGGGCGVTPSCTGKALGILTAAPPDSCPGATDLPLASNCCFFSPQTPPDRFRVSPGAVWLCCRGHL